MTSELAPIQHSYTDLAAIARAIAKSRLFGIQTEDQAIALCLIAQAEGRHPASAAMDYNIIQGRPSLTADAMLSRHLASGGSVKWIRYDDECVDAEFSHPAGGSVTIAWDTARAKSVGLLDKQNWRKWPRQMRRARCISEGVRTVNPGCIGGMYVPDEVEDFRPREEHKALAIHPEDDADYTEREQGYPPAPAGVDPNAPTWREVVTFQKFEEFPVSSYWHSMGRHWYMLTWDGVLFWAFYLPSSEAGKAAADEHTDTKRISGKLYNIEGEPWPQIKSVKYLEVKNDA